MMKKLHSAHVYLTDTKRNNVRYNTLVLQARVVEKPFQWTTKVSVVAPVDDKEGSDADASSHSDSAPHHL